MAGYVIHIAVAQEYLKNHKENNEKEFIYGAIYPDLVKPKSESHYGKSPAYTNLHKFLLKNEIDTSLKRGIFLHLVTDYLFYNHYLETFSREFIYNDYDILNKKLIEKYNVILLDEIKDVVSYKEGETKILSYELACKVIDEISKLNLDEVKEEVEKNQEKWNKYKNII